MATSVIKLTLKKAQKLKTSDPQSARKLFESIVKTPEVLGDNELFVQAYTGHSWTLLIDGETLIAKSLALEALSRSSGLPKTFRAGALAALANAEHDTGEYLNSREHFLEALQISVELNDREMESRFRCNLGRLHKAMGDMPGAIDFYMSALSACADNRGWQAYLTTLQNLANLALTVGDALSARSYLDLASAAPITNENHYNSLSLLNGYAILCNLEKNFSEAIDWTGRLLEKAGEMNAMHLLAEAYSMRAEAFFGLGQVAESHDAITKACQLDVHFHTRLLAKSKLAKISAHAGLVDQALKVIEEVESEFGTLRADYKDLVFDNLSLAKASLLDFNGAYNDKLLSIELYDQLYSAQVKADIVSLRLLMQIERKEHARQLQELKALQDRELTKLRVEKLEQQTRQTAMHLAAQTEMLSNFQINLRRIIKNATDPALALKEVNERLKELPCEQIDWLRFESEFANAHPDFKEKLKEKYPELSAAELRLCTLIRLDLKTPEIARMTCLSERTIETQRLSVRRKLQLSREDNLPEILKTV